MKHTFGHRAEHEPLEARTAVCAEDNEPAVVRFRPLDDFAAGGPLGNHDFHWHCLVGSRFREPFELP